MQQLLCCGRIHHSTHLVAGDQFVLESMSVASSFVSPSMTSSRVFADFFLHRTSKANIMLFPAEIFGIREAIDANNSFSRTLSFVVATWFLTRCHDPVQWTLQPFKRVIASSFPTALPRPLISASDQSTTMPNNLVPSSKSLLECLHLLNVLVYAKL